MWAWIELSTDDILNVLPLYILDDRDDALKKDTGKTFANSHDQGQIFKFWRHQNDFLTSCLSYLKYFYVFTFYAKQYSQLLKNKSFQVQVKTSHSKVKSFQFSGINLFFFFFFLHLLFVYLSPKSGQTCFEVKKIDGYPRVGTQINSTLEQKIVTTY